MLVQSIPYPSGAPAAVKHRFWRLNISANQTGASNTLIEELEFRESPGGADATGAGSAISGGGFTSSTPGNAFNDNVASAYNPNGSSGYIGYDFGLPGKAIVEVAIITSSATTLANLIKDFTLEWSDDGSSWTDSGNGTMHYYGPLFDHTHVFPEAAAASGYHRFWRLFCVDNNGGTTLVLEDIQFRATSGGSDQTAVLTNDSGDASGRSIGSGSNQHWKCFDSLTAGADPYFMGSATNAYAGYIFPNPVKVEEILAQCYTNVGRAPNNAKVEYSDDGVTWTAQKTFAFGTWTSLEQKVVAAI